MPGNFKRDDLRVIRTRKALLKALPILLSRRKFSSITVNDICDEAQLSRAAFYARFQDKYDFLKYYLFELRSEIACDVSNYEQFEKSVNGFVRERAKIITHILQEINNETLEILKCFIISILKVPDEKDANGRLTQNYIMLTNFCAGGIVNLLKWQIKNNFPEDAPIASEYFYNTLKCLLSWDNN